MQVNPHNKILSSEGVFVLKNRQPTRANGSETTMGWWKVWAADEERHRRPCYGGFWQMIKISQ